MEVTEERWNELIERISVAESKAEKAESKLADFEKNAPKPKRPREWATLSREIHEHTQRYDHDHEVASYKLDGAINVILRFALGVKNVYQINETNIDDAREVVDELKKII